MVTLSKQELVQLIGSVFPRFETDRVLGILVDFPNNAQQDNRDWTERRQTAFEWASYLGDAIGHLQYDRVEFIGYPHVGSNNADLPQTLYFISHILPKDADDLVKMGTPVALEKVLAETHVFLAPTEYSTTAPLKVAGKRYGFRAATMPGFCSEMIPALRVDYGEVGRRVDLVKDKLDKTDSAQVTFSVDGAHRYNMFFDLSFHNAHASSGRFPEKGAVGNLPSGEAYIVPYEGHDKTPSKTRGILPVQFQDGIVFYTIENNRAISVEGEGDCVERERELIAREVAYSNIAELGFGLLGDFGIQPIGEILLDEKLGFHVAFGRSEHFGGSIGPSQFSSPKAVVHIDRIYITATQPRITIESIVLNLEDGDRESLMKNGQYLIF